MAPASASASHRVRALVLALESFEGVILELLATATGSARPRSDGATERPSRPRSYPSPPRVASRPARSFRRDASRSPSGHAATERRPDAFGLLAALAVRRPTPNHLIHEFRDVVGDSLGWLPLHVREGDASRKACNPDAAHLCVCRRSALRAQGPATPAARHPRMTTLVRSARPRDSATRHLSANLHPRHRREAHRTDRPMEQV